MERIWACGDIDGAAAKRRQHEEAGQNAQWARWTLECARDVLETVTEIEIFNDV